MLAACAGAPVSPVVTFNPAALPAAVQAPAGNKVVLELVGKGDAIYECKTFGLGTPNPTHSWAFLRPEAKLLDRSGKHIGRYSGPPATWDLFVGSRVTGKEQATAPGVAGGLPLQLVKADPATGSQDILKGVTFIQRVNIQGGVAPTGKCDWMNDRQTVNVPYQADYIFYKAM
ncbi:MAG: DUF3455 domain-containing protein [Haliea sp.]|nr:MAG: DUF3455 domain-containing protein [Haliea sp.]